MSEKTVKEELEEIKGLLETQPKIKKMKLPAKARVSRAKLEKGFVGIMFIDDNKNVRFTKQRIIGDTVKDGDTIHVVTPKHLLSYKNKPFALIPKWQSEAWSADEQYLTAVRDKSTTHGHKLIMARMESDQIKDKLKASGKWLLWLLLAGIAAYLIFGGGWQALTGG